MSIFDRLRGRRASPRQVDSPPISLPDRPLDYPNDVFQVPVLVVSFLPETGGRISRRVTGDIDAPLETIREHTSAATEAIIRALELGSVYHGYRDPSARPSLRYQVAATIEFMEPVPTWEKPGHAVPMTNYRAIMDRLDICRWVMEEGIREVWIWGYHGGVVDLWESNMAGPFGDVSNSDRDPQDLPVFERTYTVYHYNYGRGASEAVENHMHQIEALFRDRDEELFWKRFVGGVGEGRCGWSHFPPNGRRDYDWANHTPVETDIEDWRPEGGPRRLLDCRRWNGDSLTWFIYWMQNLPGRDNSLDYHGRSLTNWWRFVGDWDEARRGDVGLVE